MRAAHTSERRSLKHIVNAIDYNLISQQRWSIEGFPLRPMLSSVVVEISSCNLSHLLCVLDSAARLCAPLACGIRYTESA
ncbi:hypothetical protein ACN38_g13099 [Penicillium nordicum]|uniref:Uncharacterized protein n=1 Tax=Penicillium nordicum TaxID=229535 RepID=A0A0M8NW65_9EURO|nr:hypothetical protein ACN38_g13099 [Penicillium nordicum]